MHAYATVRDDPTEATRCARLWAEVMLAGIADAEADKAGARGWIGSGNFLIVAELAGLDRDAARTWAAAQRRRWAQQTETADR